MRTLTLIVAATAALTAGCQQDNKNVERKLDELSKQVAALDKKIDQVSAAGVGRAAPPAERKRRPQPDPKDVFAVPIDGDPFIGPADALVTIVKGYEYACPYCEKVRPTLDQLMKDYEGKIRIVAKQYVVHPQSATAPALAFCAAGKQGFGKEMDTLLWEKAFAMRKFDEAHLKTLAAELKTVNPRFDVAKWEADMKGDCPGHIQKDQAELQAVGQTGTPAFYINGRFLSGAQPLPAFKAVIDEELAKAQARVNEGTRASDYYKTWVIEKGLKKYVPKAQ